MAMKLLMLVIFFAIMVSGGIYTGSAQVHGA